MSLFFYCDDVGLTWLREGRLPFVDAESLQDPFICNRSVKEPDQVVPVSDEEFRAELSDQYRALPESLSSMMTFEYFQAQAVQKRATIEASIRQRSQPEPLAIPEKTRKNLTFISLYERADNPMLWQHYGAKHQGFVIELDQTHEFFTAAKYHGDPQLFKPVKYGQERPLKLKQTHPFSPLFHRSEHYASEREWRVLRPVSVADKSIAKMNSRFYLHRMPASIIKSVTLGAMITDELKNTLLNLLKTDLRYRHIPVFECRLDSTQYLIHRIELKG